MLFCTADVEFHNVGFEFQSTIQVKLIFFEGAATPTVERPTLWRHAKDESESSTAFAAVETG